jgi:hypothetical protein
MNLTNQAVGAIMVAVQIGILEKKDITEIIKGFVMKETVEGLVVENPPVLAYSEEDLEAMGIDTPDKKEFVY